MDIDKNSFYALLLDVLTDISESHFVAVDLELSGIPPKQPFGSGAGKPSLQQRYLETKEAAERYQILQFGLTCVRQDLHSGKYVLQPYNFTLSPLIEERGLDVERIFSFQSGAVEFLMKTGFDMRAPFAHGVPYMSRDETHDARKKHSRRQDRGAISDIQIKPTETESLAFLDRVRNEIKAWLTSAEIDLHEYVNIGVPNAAADLQNGEPQAELSRFEKRLVHQLVRAEFPELVTLSKRGYIQIIRFDQQREDRIQAARKLEFNERLNRQKGFRWVLEALRGSDLTNLDLRECARDPATGDAVFCDLDDYRAQFYRAHARIRGKPKPLVGHNCFLDFVYIYRQFVGVLPDTVEAFRDALHAIWPTVVDTKYMSTHNCGDISPVSSLEQIALQLRAQAKPVVETDPDHDKYENAEALHEAGYDSFLTAQIAVRLSAKLEQDGAYVDAEGEAQRDGKNLANRVDKVKLVPAEPVVVPEVASFTPSVSGEDWSVGGDRSLPAYESSRDAGGIDWDAEAKKGVEGGMPGWDSDFWRVYGNKLRVFGTEEGVCVLDARDDEDKDEGQGGIKLS